ncbi:MAG: hypothetical protein KGL12_13185 [Rhodospirillales bacterium]|nr:hypothetical protein [Rhodospirillales bacterium]
MNPDVLQDRIYWGSNVAARQLGGLTDAYRPRDASAPVVAENRYLRLPAAFTGPEGKFIHANPYGSALAYGIFDAAYTRVGDYLTQGADIWFIAAQQPLLPVLCVRTNRTVSFNRAVAPTATGVNAYGGVTAATTTPLLTCWPANVLGASGGGRPEADLPGDSTVPYWTVLLPALPGVVLRTADLMVDDLGRNAVVAAVELSDLGWRLTVKQATT